MALQINAAAHACQTVTRQVRDRFRHLSIHYIVHHEGQHTEAMGMAGQAVLHHPAAETALHLLTRARHDEEASLIGMAVARENLFMGLACCDSVLALCSVNIDRSAKAGDITRQAWHLAWHAIDAYEYHSELAHRSGGTMNEIIVRRRNALEMASVNLQADTFAAIMTAQDGNRLSVRSIGMDRGRNVLYPGQSHAQGPEHFPFIIAMESAELAMKQLARRPVAKRRHIDAALKIAREVAHTFDEASIKHWMSFSEPAQDMAWRGYSSEQILSAAINTSEDTYVRATGYMVSEITGIKPASVLDIRDAYSPYADAAFNEKLHDKAVNAVFEYVIAEGLHQGSIDAFMETANRQNQGLLQGHINGWCASALQASGRAFESALKDGAAQAAHAARRRFENERDDVEWESLEILGRKIVGRARQGRSVTMEDIAGICHDERNLAAVARSIDLSLKDPALRNARAPAHTAAPAPRSPAPAAARRLAAVPGPGFGSVGGGAVRTSLPSVMASEDTGEQRQ